jgi:uncharacterized membrane protein
VPVHLSLGTFLGLGSPLLLLVMSSKPQSPIRLPRFSTIHLLASILLLFVSTAFIEDVPDGRVIEGVLLTIVLLSALVAVSGRRTLWIGMVLAALALGGQWVSIAGAKGLLSWIYFFPALAFLGLVIGRLLHFVLRTSEVNIETLCASISGFLMIGLLWTMLYTLLGRMDPMAFQFSQPGQTMDGFDAFYFSFVTLSTIGFGDITPVSRVARMLAVMQAITGMFYVAVLISRLVSIHAAKAMESTKGPQ